MAKGTKSHRRGRPGATRPRGRPPQPTAPLKVQLDPRIKLDYLLAADELRVPLSFLVEHILIDVRGDAAGTAKIKDAFARALASQTANR